MKKIISCLLAVSITAGMAFPGVTASAETEKYISDIMVVGLNPNEYGSGSESAVFEMLEEAGYTVINYDLNKSCGLYSDFIYMGYKTTENRDEAIRDIIVIDKDLSSSDVTRTIDGVEYQLCPYDGGSHFKDIYGDLNSHALGASPHVYYTKDSSLDTAVTEIYFNTDPEGAVSDMNLNEGSVYRDQDGGNRRDSVAEIYMHLNYSGEKKSTALMGDVNDDGKFNSADALAFSKWLTGVSDSKLANRKNGDMDENGKLNIADFCLMKSELLKEDTSENTKLSAFVSKISSDFETKTVEFDIKTTGDFPADAWVGIVPKGTEHDEYSADKVDIDYKYIVNITDGHCTLKMSSSAEGMYEVRVYADDKGGDELFSQSFYFGEAAPAALDTGVYINHITVNKEKSTVEFDIVQKLDFPVSAWVGIVPAGTKHDEVSADDKDIAYKYLSNITDDHCALSMGSAEEGEYEIRVYADDKGGDELFSKTFKYE